MGWDWKLLLHQVQVAPYLNPKEWWELSNGFPITCGVHFAYYISFTTPRLRDACRSALVSPAFRSASSSNAVWENFLPPDYEDFISQSSSLNLLSKKGLYLHLCHHPPSSVMAPWYAKVNTSYNLSLLLFFFF